MRAQHLQQTRPQWYDRNPLVIVKLSQLFAVGPFGPSTGWNYTVPANRKCVIESTQATIWRDTAAAAPLDRWAGINLQDPLTTNTWIPWAVSMSNTVDNRQDLFGALQAVALAGNVISCSLSDQSTGGTSSFIAAMKATEYDN